MGNQACCFKPTEPEIQGLEESGEDFPKDTVKKVKEELEPEKLKEVSNQKIYQEGVQTSNTGKEYDVAINNPNIDNQNGEDEANKKESNEQGDDAAQENYTSQEVNAQIQEGVEGEGKGQEGEIFEEEGKEQGGEEAEGQEKQQGGEEEGGNPLVELGETLVQTQYLNIDNNNNIQQEQATEPQKQAIQSQEEINQNFNLAGTNAANDANLYLTSYNESGGFISETIKGSQAQTDLKSLQVLSPGAGNDDINKYFQQGTETSTTGNIDLNNLGLENTQNENIDYNQYFQQSASATTGNVDLAAYGIPSTAQGSSGDEDLNKYFQNITDSKNVELENKPTGTFDLENLNIGQTSTTGNVEYGEYNATSNTGNMDLNAYGIQGAEVSTNNAASSYITIPKTVQSSAISFGLQDSLNYNQYQSQVISKKVESSFVNPGQSVNYNYSYNVPGTTQAQY